MRPWNLKAAVAAAVSAVIALGGCAPVTDVAEESTKSRAPTACAPTAQPLQPNGSRDMVIGTAYRSTFADGDDCYRDVASSQFGSLTTEIGTMTNTMYPARGRFDFRAADAVAGLAKKSGQAFQVHSLIWDPLDQQVWKIVPDHLRRLSDADRHREMLTIVTTAMKRYRGQTDTATVVNEPFDQSGTIQPNLWWQTTKSDRYIFDAFRAARLADPKAKLYINEHSSETKSDKSNALYSLAERLRGETVAVDVDGQTKQMPLIDGVGFQGHMLGGEDQQPDPADMKENFQRFADLGLDIRLTELDVRVPVKDGSVSPADTARQADVYATMTRLCTEQPRCTGITLWGFTDKRSWITDYPATFSGYGAATPMTADYAAKPAWDRIRATAG